MKDMTRALRRHHAARIQRARRFHFGLDNRTDPIRYGKVLHTATPCSCWMCGNRRYHDGPSRQERCAQIKLKEFHLD